MSAGVCNLLIEQGATFTRNITLKAGSPVATPMDLTGYTARASIKQNAQTLEVAAAFVCTFAADRTTGIITITLDAATTAALYASGTDYSKLQKYTWDMEIEIGGVVTRILNGTVQVSPEVTK